MDNVPPNWEGRVIIEAEDYEGAAEFIFDGKHGAFPSDGRPIGQIEGLRFTSPGAKFVTIRDVESGISAKSNAIIVTEEQAQMSAYTWNSQFAAYRWAHR